MKKILLTGFTGIFLLLVTSIAANGQLASDNMQPSGDFDPFGKTVSKDAPVDRTNVNSRVVKNFVRSYRNVSNEQWYKLQDGFVSLFNLDDIDYQVAYDKKGNWIRTIRSYEESKLSGDMRHTVKSIYYDCRINLVQEIESPDDPVTYIVQLKGKTQIINLMIRDGEMTVLRKYTRTE
jgi:hypothetical protein